MRWKQGWRGLLGDLFLAFGLLRVIYEYKFFKTIFGLINFGGAVDFVLQHWGEPGWVGDMLSTLLAILAHPHFQTLIIFTGISLLFWDRRILATAHSNTKKTASDSVQVTTRTYTKPRFEPEEIRRMLLCLGQLRDIIDLRSRPAYESLLEITQQWDLLLRQIGPRPMAERLSPIRNEVRAAERATDKIFNENQHYWNELRPVMYDGPHPPGDGLDSALSMMLDDLMELAGAQNVDVNKWLRPKFEETVKMSIQYGDWIGKVSHRLTEKTRDLREEPITK
ncbi:MAG TPA: hypothetical protein VHN11_23475 [Xanthobacteraceae bacterium]|jgi:hypothetical protein|nr:hypothetical protein [Xanthobacteraceae bacterium]